MSENNNKKAAGSIYDGLPDYQENQFLALKFINEQIIAFNKHIQLQVVAAEDGYGKVEVPYQAFLLGNPVRPALHGGIVASILDSVGGVAAMTTLTSYDDKISTIDLRIDYLAPANTETLIAEAKILRSGRSTVVTDMTIHHGDPDQPVAYGRAAYNVKRVGKPNSELKELDE